MSLSFSSFLFFSFSFKREKPYHPSVHSFCFLVLFCFLFCFFGLFGKEKKKGNKMVFCFFFFELLSLIKK